MIAVGDGDTAALYWKLLHDEIRRRTNRRQSARIVAESLDWADFIDPRGDDGSFVRTRRRLTEAARRLVKQGAEGILLCGGPLHVHADAVRAALDEPVLHIAMATAEKLHSLQLGPAALLGPDRSTGEEKRWLAVLVEGGIRRTVHMSELDRTFVHDRLQRGLTAGTVTDELRAAFTRLSVDLKHGGARIIVLTRPELACALREEDSALPTLCAVQAHCEQVARFALEPESKLASAGG
ncbi:MAG: aspartate/glutamate racemase family protein [Candidatus Didemnitutus sp.]|nr:aspartate/glutamate racemase family protein [Candidatus Didemnitutus sp.]